MPDAYATAVSDVPRDGSRMHTHDHGLAVELSLISYLEPRVDKHNLLRGGYSDLGISSLRSTGGGSGGDGNAAVTTSIRARVKAILSVWIWVGHSDDGSNGDGTGGGDECVGGAMHLVRRSPAEGGDSEIGGDGDGVVMARNLLTSASGGRDMEA
ncbi:hypothetical protein Tco_0034833 [Tanacetum coccineum]